MTQWCNNMVTITGPAAVIGNFWEQTQLRGSLLSVMVPEPCYVTEANCERKLTEWRRQHWGTEQDLVSHNLRFVKNTDSTASVFGSFHSVHTPPVAAVDTYQQHLKHKLGISTHIELMYVLAHSNLAGHWKNGQHVCLQPAQPPPPDPDAQHIAEFVAEWQADCYLQQFETSSKDQHD